MVGVLRRWSACGLGLLLLAGCQLFPVRERIDEAVCGTAARPVDPQPPSHAAAGEGALLHASALLPVRQADKPGGKAKPSPLEVPPALPGGTAPPLPVLPRGEKERDRALEKVYPPLPAPGAAAPLPPGPSGHPLTLADLQLLAASNSPLLRQAAAEVEEARGAAVQAGLAPNPVAGYQADTIRQGDSAGLQGGFVEQTIKTAGKLTLARARAERELRVAELAYGRARFDLVTQVRAGYFNVLAARESARVSRALVEFTDRVYRLQVGRLRAGQAALYEPAQLRVLSAQARNALIQARNREVSAWKALASTLGLPALPPAQLAGRLDMPLPVYRYDDVLARVLNGHTDVRTAAAAVERDQIGLQLAQATPIPDVNVGFVVQKDNTTPPFNVVYNLRVGLPIPVWDKNQGNIQSAQARLERSLEGAHRARNELTTRLAEAYERYAANRAQLENYTRYILPDQVRAFRGAYDAHQQDPNRVGFGEVVNAQQTLATSVTAYVTTLTAVWTAAVDVANLLQTDDLFQQCEAHRPAPVPDLTLPELPCCHPCSPLPDPALKGADGSWPAEGAPAPTAPAAPATRPEQLGPPAPLGDGLRAGPGAPLPPLPAAHHAPLPRPATPRRQP